MPTRTLRAVAGAVETDDFSGLDSPEVVDATEALEAAELDHCGIVAGEEVDGGG